MIHTIHNTVQSIERNGLLLNYLYERPISKVEIVGVVVSVDCRVKRINYHIDDGTGIIRCVKYLDGISNYIVPCMVGDTVDVKGMLEKFSTNDEKYGFSIRIQNIEKLLDTNMEIYHSLLAMDLCSSEYQQPY